MIRSNCSVENYEFFRDTDYSKQYYKTYCIRLECMNKALQARASEKWGNDILIRKLADLVPDEQCVVIGILYKHMEGKPSVIKELTDSHQLGLRSVPPHKLTSSKDRLFLEDLYQRIQLSPESIDVQKYVTGVIIALLGRESELSKGMFIVEDVVHATPHFSIIKNPKCAHISQYIAIISGIGLEDNFGVSITLKLALDWMCGNISMNEIKIDPSKIGRLIIAGDSLATSKNRDTLLQNTTKKGVHTNVIPSEILDKLLDNVCSSIPIDLMPGPNDPTSIVLPQKPLHKVMFPAASTWSTFKCRTNPWMFNLENGAFVIGTSGQNIDDIDRYSEINDPLERLRATITWSHCAPTAPDTLPTYPNVGQSDPLIIPHRPYLYFAGNQDQFAWTRCTEADPGTTLLVSVPRFKDTGAVVLVDVTTDSCLCLTFENGPK